MPEISVSSASQTVSQLAAMPAVHRAFQWFHLQEPQLRRWHREIVSIAAPTFSEMPRAKWLCERFLALGLSDVHIDQCGNALGWLRGIDTGTHHAGPARQEPPPQQSRCTLFSAHLDTVFPGESIGEAREEGSRLFAPGASDNGAGITALLAVAAAIRSAGVQPAGDILFTGNVGEEGEGNLRGMRYLFSDSPLSSRIRAAVILDGVGTDSIVAEGLGSRRFCVTITGPGGHSWADAGRPNPIMALAAALTNLGGLELPMSPRTTMNIGRIEGGTSINSIPEHASARIDTRSTDAEQLLQVEVQLYRAVEDAVLNANRAAGDATGRAPLLFQIETVGERPAARLPDDAAILNAIRAVDRHLAIHSQLRIASTDANIPLSLGVDAISIGAGGSGGGIHTAQEWFDAAGRDLALRRVLLLLLTLTQTHK